MLGAADLVSFVGTRDLAPSHAFYGAMLGLERVDASSFANVYDVAGTALRVTLVDHVVRAPYAVARLERAGHRGRDQDPDGNTLSLSQLTR